MDSSLSKEVSEPMELWSYGPACLYDLRALLLLCRTTSLPGFDPRRE